MCAPAAIAIASLAMTAASAATQYQGQQEQASAQSDFEKQNYYYTRKSATANYLQQVGSIQQRGQQDTAQTVDQSRQNVVDATKAKGSMVANLAGHGVTGNSVNEALADFDRIEQLNQTNLQTNLSFRRQQATADIASARASAMDRINAAVMQPVQYPSALAAGLGVGAASLQTFDKVEANSNPNYGKPILPPIGPPPAQG